AERSCLLFADLSVTHFVHQGQPPPELADSERRVDALAAFHAHWWQHPRLRADIGAGADDVPGYVFGVARDAFASFTDAMGDRLSAERRKLYERIFEAWPPIRGARLAAGRHVTLVHGDTHNWNFLMPRDPSVNRARIIDWAVWHLGVGPADL